MTLADLSEVASTLPRFSRGQLHFTQLNKRSRAQLKKLPVDKQKNLKLSVGVGMIIAGLVASTGLDHSQAARMQQLRTLESMVGPGQTLTSIEVQPVESPEAIVAEIAAEKVEPTPTPTVAVAGVSVSRFSGDVAAMIRQAATARWNAAQAESLLVLMHKESGLNPYAINRSSGACGIPQALPCSKLLNVIGSLDNVEGQVQWLLNYVANRYGTPANALAFHRANNWY